MPRTGCSTARRGATGRSSAASPGSAPRRSTASRWPAGPSHLHPPGEGWVRVRAGGSRAKISPEMMLDTGVLVLNRVYQPVHITSVRRAFALLYQGAARAIDEEYKLF